MAPARISHNEQSGRALKRGRGIRYSTGQKKKKKPKKNKPGRLALFPDSRPIISEKMFALGRTRWSPEVNFISQELRWFFTGASGTGNTAVCTKSARLRRAGRWSQPSPHSELLGSNRLSEKRLVMLFTELQCDGETHRKCRVLAANLSLKEDVTWNTDRQIKRQRSLRCFSSRSSGCFADLCRC